MEHELKLIPPYFQHVSVGAKNFEVRYDDRGYNVGDLLILREYEPDEGRYTGRELHRTVGYILRGPLGGLAEGWVILRIG